MSFDYGLDNNNKLRDLLGAVDELRNAVDSAASSGGIDQLEKAILERLDGVDRELRSLNSTLSDISDRLRQLEDRTE